MRHINVLTPTDVYHQVRLVGGPSSFEGRVEVYHDGVWGTVCENKWDRTDALVVCRQLGLPTDNVKAYKGGRYGRSLGPVLLDNVRCSGSESGLASCPSNGWYNHNCTHSEDAGVSCGE